MLKNNTTASIRVEAWQISQNRTKVQDIIYVFLVICYQKFLCDARHQICQKRHAFLFAFVSFHQDMKKIVQDHRSSSSIAVNKKTTPYLGWVRPRSPWTNSLMYVPACVPNTIITFPSSITKEHISSSYRVHNVVKAFYHPLGHIHLSHNSFRKSRLVSHVMLQVSS